MWPLLAATLLLLASIGPHVYLFRLNRQNNAELAGRLVSVDDYNNLVRSQNKLATLVTNQQTLLDEQQTELSELARQYDRLDGACVKIGSLAELYIKMSEYDERLREQKAVVDVLQAKTESLVQGTNRVDRLRAEVEGLMQVTNKVDALQRALIKLSLRFQNLQPAGKPDE
jgi:small nuclear ribonucleoprotein (snRNP)-like protein